MVRWGYAAVKLWILQYGLRLFQSWVNENIQGIFPKKMVNTFLEGIQGRTTSTSVYQLFKVRDKEMRDILEKERAESFQKSVVNILFICNRARSDIHLDTAFLSTRVKILTKKIGVSRSDYSNRCMGASIYPLSFVMTTLSSWNVTLAHHMWCTRIIGVTLEWW